MTLFADDEWDDGVSSPADDDWPGYCRQDCPDDACRAMGRCQWPEDDGPGLDWDDGPEPPPGRRVVAIETTGDKL